MSIHPIPRWLPEIRGGPAALSAAVGGASLDWAPLRRLAGSRLDLPAIRILDDALTRVFPAPPADTDAVRLAVLSTSTTKHLFPSIRVHGLRRGLHVTLCEGPYGQVLQPLLDPESMLRAFRPDAILLALDAHFIAAGFDSGMDSQEVEARYATLWAQVEQIWQLAAELAAGPVLHQAPLPILPAVLGENEHRLAGSPAAIVARFSAELRARADRAGVHLVALEARVARDGLAAWHDPVLWYRTKQEVSLAAAPVYGDLVARVLAVSRGRSAKCLVLDLDDTLWGGVVGDDGLEGLRLGQGSAEGEAFVAFQRYVLELKRRGVVLAVCSKNDEARALEPFERHPEMVLRRSDIACFVANWNNKADNLRHIAATLNLGLDALVFVDDNPAERDLVRNELPEVAVPEVPDDPALVPQCLADAGYFESLGLTAEDRQRAGFYQGNAQREALRSTVTNMAAYLSGLAMQLRWGAFDDLNQSRVVQLVNKTNQFNLTTRRHAAAALRSVREDPKAAGLHFRLLDRFGDNGLIAVVILAMPGSLLAPEHLAPGDALIDTWLMSCRVLGRRVEEATLAVIVPAARRLGATRLVGEYRPSAKNAMVADHYEKLGFTKMPAEAGGPRWFLDLATYRPPELPITLQQEPDE